MKIIGACQSVRDQFREARAIHIGFHMDVVQSNPENCTEPSSQRLSQPGLFYLTGPRENFSEFVRALDQTDRTEAAYSDGEIALSTAVLCDTRDHIFELLEGNLVEVP